MTELLPETWIPDCEDTSTSQRCLHRAPISDILIWAKCFCLMAAVLSEKFPHKTTHLFAYQWLTIHATKTFRGTAWVAYDRLYRRQAASQHSLDWAAEDPALYNEAFMGQAKIMAQCHHCLSENHQSEACQEFLADCLWSPFPLPSPPTHPCTQPNTPQAVKYVENSMTIAAAAQRANIAMCAWTVVTHTQLFTVTLPDHHPPIRCENDPHWGNQEASSTPDAQHTSNSSADRSDMAHDTELVA